MMLTFGLAALAGCGDTGNQSLSWTGTLTVENQGSSALNGVAEDWDGAAKHSFSLNPGDSVSFEFDTPYRVKLHAWRTSDGLLLIDDFWEAGDLMDGVRVTLKP
jgi:hypothetical protein